LIRWVYGCCAVDERGHSLTQHCIENHIDNKCCVILTAFANVARDEVTLMPEK